jgi:tRNA threonylcarbamoyladenosine modification (KEOPS) complex  Pcc1 subunit
MSRPSHVVEVVLPTPSEAEAHRLVRVLEIEAAATPEGTRIVVDAEAGSVRLRVEASSAADLRAATNSILRVASVAQDTSRAAQSLKR